MMRTHHLSELTAQRMQFPGVQGPPFFPKLSCQSLCQLMDTTDLGYIFDYSNMTPFKFLAESQLVFRAETGADFVDGLLQFNGRE